MAFVAVPAEGSFANPGFVTQRFGAVGQIHCGHRIDSHFGPLFVGGRVGSGSVARSRATCRYDRGCAIVVGPRFGLQNQGGTMSVPNCRTDVSGKWIHIT